MGAQVLNPLGWPVGQHGSFVQASVGLVRQLHRQKLASCRSQLIPRAKSREVEKGRCCAKHGNGAFVQWNMHT